jgi:hypothetical protein
MNVDHLIKYIIIVILSSSLQWNIFGYDFFLMFGHAHIFFSFIVICTHLRCYITIDVYVTLLCEMKWLKNLVHQKMMDILFPKYYFLYICFCSKKYFDTCFDNLRIFLVFCITSLYSTSYMVLTHLYLHKHVFNNMDIYLSNIKKNLNT